MKGIVLVSLWAALAAGPVFAQTKPAGQSAGLGKGEAGSNVDRNLRAYIELLRTDVRTSKAQIMGEVMQLDATQATKFWPIYKDFERELTALGDRTVGVVTKYAKEIDKMTDAIADQLGGEVLAVEQSRNALKKKTYDRVKQECGAILAVRFLQVENQLERIVDLQIAAELPIIEAGR